MFQMCIRDRLISSALKMITDMERIGDQAADIAEIIGFTNLSTHALSPVLIKMAQATSKMVTDSIDAFVKRDIALARQVMQYDDIVAVSYTHLDVYKRQVSGYFFSVAYKRCIYFFAVSFFQG